MNKTKPASGGNRIAIWRPVATVRKYDKDGNLYETISSEGNLLTDNGISRISDLLVGNSSSPLDLDHARLGVGDSSTPSSPSDSSLGTNEYYGVLDDEPTIEGSTINWRTEFGDSDANFEWACWGIDVDDNGSVSASDTPAELFNRKVFNFGTKSGGTWSLSVTISIAQE